MVKKPATDCNPDSLYVEDAGTRMQHYPLLVPRRTSISWGERADYFESSSSRLSFRSDVNTEAIIISILNKSNKTATVVYQCALICYALSLIVVSSDQQLFMCCLDEVYYDMVSEISAFGIDLHINFWAFSIFCTFGNRSVPLISSLGLTNAHNFYSCL